LKLIQLPPPTAEIGTSPAWHALLKRLLSASIRVLSKGMLKSWMTEFVFYSTPLTSLHPKEQGKEEVHSAQDRACDVKSRVGCTRGL
jgi:mediator of RNA polymerase II transcription subunit 14